MLETMNIQQHLEFFYTYIREHASIVYLLVSNEGRIIETNRFADELLGDDLTDKLLKDVIVDFHQSFDLDHLKSDPRRVHLLNVHTRSGLPQTLHFQFLDQGDAIIVFGNIDVGELEDMRRQLLSFNNELNNLTRELNKKNVQLKMFDEQKNRFLGMAAHDIRNPIHGILMYSDFLLDETKDILGREHLEFIALIRKFSGFIFQIVDEMLDVSVIESGKLILDRYPVNLTELVHANIQLNQILAQKKKIRIQFKCECDLPEISIDAGKINQVLTNLLSNAVKFSYSDTQIEIRLFKKDDFAVIAVQDQGQGIPEIELHNIFEPFQRTSVKTTEGEKSSGLGLAIACKVAQEHGGKLWVESQVGRGSTFFLSLPLTSGTDAGK